MAAQAGQNVVAVLPGGGGEDQFGIGWDVEEDVHAHALRGDEAVAGDGVDGKGAEELVAPGGEDLGEAGLEIALSGPAGLVGGETEVSAGDEVDGFGVGCGGLLHLACLLLAAVAGTTI